MHETAKRRVMTDKRGCKRPTRISLRLAGAGQQRYRTTLHAVLYMHLCKGFVSFRLSFQVGVLQCVSGLRRFHFSPHTHACTMHPAKANSMRGCALNLREQLMSLSFHFPEWRLEVRKGSECRSDFGSDAPDHARWEEDLEVRRWSSMDSRRAPLIAAPTAGAQRRGIGPGSRSA